MESFTRARERLWALMPDACRPDGRIDLEAGEGKADAPVVLNNCYSFALCDMAEGRAWAAHPGQWGGKKIAGRMTRQKLVDACIADGLIPQPGNRPPDMDKPGYYLVAAYFSGPVEDFHFARREQDGSWLQKDGTSPVVPFEFAKSCVLEGAKYNFVHFFWCPNRGLITGERRYAEIKHYITSRETERHGR